MATKNGNHRKSMSQPERAFWRDVFKAIAPWHEPDEDIDESVERAADFADKSVDEYRKRITWRKS